jgi:outer membrane protein OmpA-like peptidoglycan-associated protein
VLLLISALALADGASIEAETVRPGPFDVLPGVPGAQRLLPGAWKTELVVQAEDRPLVMVSNGEILGPVVDFRLRTDLHGAVALGKYVALGADLPLIWQGSGDFATAQGLGIGSASLHARFTPLQVDRNALAVRAAVALPAGRAEAWSGEQSVAVGGGVSGTVGNDQRGLFADLGVMARPVVDTGLGPSVGTEISLGGGARLSFDERWSASVGVTGHSSVSARSGGADAYEALAMVRHHGRVYVDVGLGRGLGGGLGASTIRGFVGIGLQRVFRDVVEPVDTIVVDDLPDEPRPPDISTVWTEAPAPVEWQEGELARVVGESIELREPIRFEVGTTKVLPESLPLLAAVATLVQPDTMLVIEGHSSEEGEATANYELSMARARSIWEELIRAGVPPQRMSYRGLGESAPVAGDLAQSRRVMLWLVKINRPAGAPPLPDRPSTLPWEEAKPMPVTP